MRISQPLGAGPRVRSLTLVPQSGGAVTDAAKELRDNLKVDPSPRVM
jgi:hypothetical protein